MVEVISFSSPAELARTVAGRWLDILQARTGSATLHCVALSGGRIAKGFFAETARQALERNTSFGGVHFFWGDERCVPPTDPESNYAIARDLLFEPLKIPELGIHRLKGEADEAVALDDAVKEITKRTSPDAKDQPVLDLIFLGMGEDGHVASLFPGEPADVMSNPAIFRAVTAVKPPPRRITLGYGAIAAAREVWVLASGKGKEQALRESLAPQGKTPLARVLRSRAQTKVFTDIETRA